MGKAVLIYGGTKKSRVGEFEKISGLENIDKITQNINPDLLIVKKDDDKKSIGIDKAREIKKFLKEKPLSGNSKTVVMLNAEILTTEAQNALLKTLEEPPEYGEIFLLSKTEDALLGTVVSRCKKIRIQGGDENLEKSEIYSILELDPGKRMEKAKSLSEKDKDDILFELERWAAELRKGEKNIKNFANISRILKIKNDMENINVSTVLALENLLLHLK